MSGNLLEIISLLTNELSLVQGRLSSEASRHADTDYKLQRATEIINAQVKDTTPDKEKLMHLAEAVASGCHGLKIQGIKILQLATGLGLREAKELFEEGEKTAYPRNRYPDIAHMAHELRVNFDQLIADAKGEGLPQDHVARLMKFRADFVVRLTDRIARI
jgi:ribosomal protein L7/L12